MSDSAFSLRYSSSTHNSLLSLSVLETGNQTIRQTCAYSSSCQLSASSAAKHKRRLHNENLLPIHLPPSFLFFPTCQNPNSELQRSSSGIASHKSSICTSSISFLSSPPPITQIPPRPSTLRAPFFPFPFPSFPFPSPFLVPVRPSPLLKYPVSRLAQPRVPSPGFELDALHFSGSGLHETRAAPRTFECVPFRSVWRSAQFVVWHIRRLQTEVYYMSDEIQEVDGRRMSGGRR